MKKIAIVLMATCLALAGCAAQKSPSSAEDQVKPPMKYELGATFSAGRDAEAAAVVGSVQVDGPRQSVAVLYNLTVITEEGPDNEPMPLAGAKIYVWDPTENTKSERTTDSQGKVAEFSCRCTPVFYYDHRKLEVRRQDDDTLQNQVHLLGILKPAAEASPTVTPTGWDLPEPVIERSSFPYEYHLDSR